MYKHGKPVYRDAHKMFVISLLLFSLAVAVGGYILYKQSNKTTITNTKAHISTIKGTSKNDTQIDEPTFTATLPGAWKLSAKDWDARYHSYQWVTTDKKTNGRWFRVYVDTIPRDQAVNYLLPVTPNNDTMTVGQISDNCVNFTKDAVPESKRPVNIPLSQAALPSRWNLVDFLCDNANISMQVVGAASTEAVNTVTLKGSQGIHKYFFMYQDNSMSPDYGMMTTILGSFRAK